MLAWLRHYSCGITLGLSLVPQGFAYKHLGRTEPGYTSHKTTQVQGLQEQQHEVTLREEIPSTDDKMVMVQEDQAREPWSSYVGLYTGRR